MPFGGIYRIVDFTLSNCLNSGLRRILVLTQYKAMSLDRHITLGWRNYLCRELGEFIDVVPPQQRIDEQWYQGTADAVYQNIYTLEKERPEVRRHSRRRPHLQDGLQQADRLPPGDRRRRDDCGAAREGEGGGPAVRHHAGRRDEPRRRLRREAGRAEDRFRAIRNTAWRRWAFTCSTPTICSTSCARTPRCRTVRTTSAGTSFRR